MNSLRHKLFILLLCLGTFQFLNAQKVIISGEEGNRPLIWRDFTGNPDGNSPYHAHTKWNTRAGYTGARFNGDTATLENFLFTLQLDPDGSWVKEGKQTNELLKHEQGHFNIGLLYMNEVLKQIGATQFTRTAYREQVRKILKDTSEKYKEMEEQYDRETNHSANRKEQRKWDDFFKKELN